MRNRGLHRRPCRRLASLAWTLALFLSAVPALRADTLISTGAVWKYLDNGSNQGTAWRGIDFDDGAWTNGPAQLGFGDGDEAHVINGGPSTNRYITTYFRRAFTLDDASIYTNLFVRLLRDDGGVVYLNGTEVFRSNMPTNVITYTTLASTNVPAGDETTNFYQTNINVALLLTGTNVAAVEIHQVNNTSSDISFDLALLANVPNAPPVVNLTNPPNNSFFRAGTNITLNASATDTDGGVARVEFFEDDHKLGQDTTSPYSLVWSNVALGSYTLRAVATDILGAASTSAPVNITVVSNVPPLVTITSPTNNSALGGPLDVLLNATASDPDGQVARVEFFEGANKIGEDTTSPYSATWSNAAVGDYVLTAVATDNGGGARTSAPVALSIRTNIPPTISITAPRTNALISVQSNIVITATAADNDGGVRLVEFYEGVNKLGEDATSPYSLTVRLPAGEYSLRAVATDLAGAPGTSAPVKITVVTNLLPTVAITNPPNNALVSVRNPLTLRASAADADGAIVKVEFFQGYAKLGESTNAPYSFTLSNLTAGAYIFRAVATDNSSDSVTSAPVSLTLHNRRVLVPAGAVWKFLDNGSNQSNAWREIAFDDAGWASGRAELGYGDGDEATVVSFGTNSNAKYITTYFRHAFVVEEPAVLSNAVVRLLRDDGGVVYLNGTEIYRNNMPTGEVAYTTAALATVEDDDVFYQTNVDAGLLVSGTNVVAVEIHQANGTSSDISFDLELIASDTVTVTRGPFLQLGTPTSILVRWRTSALTMGRVLYGFSPDALTNVAAEDAPATEHVVTLSGLSHDTTYYYAVAADTEIMSGGLDHRFTTSPLPGTAKPTRIWVLGDAGTGFAGQYAVRDAYYAFGGPRPTDLWLMLGDNVYDHGLDEEYQAYLFDAYPTLLKQSVLWPTIGNHDTDNLTNVLDNFPYFEAFTMPANGEAGGVPSGTERYYSFDYGNVHFVSLDSQTSDRAPGGPMANWLRRDLAANTNLWTIVTFHHAPYSKGNNDSDTAAQQIQMRENFGPILEEYGVDLVLNGHSHCYERSFLIDGHYGLSTTFLPAYLRQPGNGRADGDGIYYKTNALWRHAGTVYVVAGSSGRTDTGPLNHPAMFYSAKQLGSLVLDVDGNRLDLKFLRETGAIDDYFSMFKVRQPNSPPVAFEGQVVATEDLPRSFALAATDANGDPLDFYIVTAPTHGALSVVGAGGANPLLADGAHLGSVSNLTYRPNPNFNGLDSFTFRVNDGFVDSEIATVFITVNAVNDPPVAMAQSVSVNEDERVEIVLLAEDVDGDPLTYTTQAPAHGTLAGTPPFLSYQSAKDYYGPDSFTFVVNDGTVQSAEAIVHITVLPVNDPPVAKSQIVTTDEDMLVAVTLDATDVEDDPLTFFVTPPAHGTLTGAPPNLIYRPAANYHGPDRFTFAAHDGQLHSVEAAVNITVLPVNDPPVADASATPQRRLISANNSNALVVLDGSRSWDVDDDPLQFAWFDGDAETPFARGRIVASLMTVGTNAVTLRVSDGVATATDGLLVSILTAAQAVQELMVQVNASSVPERLKRPLTATLESAPDKFDRGIVPAGTGQLDAFQNKVRAQAAAIGPTRAEEFIRTAQEIIDVFSASRRPTLLSCAGKTDHRIALRGAGAAGKVCLLQASSDLLTWETIGTVTARQDGSFEFEDTNTVQFSCRFYRAASPE